MKTLRHWLEVPSLEKGTPCQLDNSHLSLSRLRVSKALYSTN